MKIRIINMEILIINKEILIINKEILIINMEILLINTKIKNPLVAVLLFLHSVPLLNQIGSLVKVSSPTLNLYLPLLPWPMPEQWDAPDAPSRGKQPLTNKLSLVLRLHCKL